MKKRLFPLLLTVLMSMVGAKSFAHDIEVANDNGVTIYYVWTHGNTELSVSFRGPNCDAYQNEYTGDVVIPKYVYYNENVYTVTGIESDAFDSCFGLTSITLPSTLATIGTMAFADCTSLKAVYITDLAAWCSVENNGLPVRHLFLNGTEIKDLVIPDGVTKIGSRAFWGCADMTSVTIPNSVTSIDNGAFFMCHSLTTVTSKIENPYSISSDVFQCSPEDIYATAKLVVPEGKKSAYQSTEGWNQFTNIVEASDIGSVFEYDGINYRIGENNTVAVTRTKDITGVVLIPSFVIHNGITYAVTSIEASAFDKNREDHTITKVAIPGTIKYIGPEAFIDLKGLDGVYISDLAAWCNITFSGYGSNPLEYANHLFVDGMEVTDLIIPDGVTSIGTKAFNFCFGLHSVTIPNSVTSIGGSAFYGCIGIENVYSEIMNPFAIPDNAFEGVYTATLRVPDGTKSAYQSTAGWSNFSNILETVKIGSVFEYDGINYRIGENNTVAVTRTKDITGPILIPGFVIHNGVTYTVTSIEDSAFDKNHEDFTITLIAIPSTVKSIGTEAFVDLYGLTGVYISDLASWCNTSFGGSGSNPLEYAHHLFMDGMEVTDLIIPDGVTSIGNFAFYGCSGLTSVTIPNSVTNIGIRSFSGCTGVKNVYSKIIIPFAIPDNVFEGIPSDAVLTVPAGTKSAYQSTEGWNKFTNIVEEGADGIASLINNGISIQRSGNNVTVTGAPKGSEIIIYNLAGQKIGSAKSSSDITNIQIPLQSEGIGIVKIGKKTMRVLMK